MLKALMVIGGLLIAVGIGVGQSWPAVAAVVGVLGAGLALVWWLTDISVDIRNPLNLGPSSAGSDGPHPGRSDRDTTPAGDPTAPPPPRN